MAVPDLIEKIRTVHPSYKYRGLNLCFLCRAPVWQQPCPCCGYYPMGGGPVIQGVPFPRDQWLARVKKEGGILAWMMSHHQRNVIPEGRASVIETNQEIRAKFDIWVEPYPEQVWAHFQDCKREVSHG